MDSKKKVEETQLEKDLKILIKMKFKKVKVVNITPEQHGTYHYHLKDLFYRLNSTSKRLVHKIEWVAEDLIRAARTLKEEGPMDGIINPVGILQSRGNDIDRMCGELGMIRQIILDFVAAMGPEEVKEVTNGQDDK